MRRPESGQSGRFSIRYRTCFFRFHRAERKCRGRASGWLRALESTYKIFARKKTSDNFIGVNCGRRSPSPTNSRPTEAQAGSPVVSTTLSRRFGKFRTGSHMCHSWTKLATLMMVAPAEIAQHRPLANSRAPAA